MNTPSASPLRSLASHALRCAALGAAAAFLPVISTSSAADAPAQALLRAGSVPLTAAGPYVEVGTFRIQVSAKLGQPDLKLRDGTWLYQHRRIEGSTAEGTLVIRFEKGRVQALSLATPAVVAALGAEGSRAAERSVFATK